MNLKAIIALLLLMLPLAALAQDDTAEPITLIPVNLDPTIETITFFENYETEDEVMIEVPVPAVGETGEPIVANDALDWVATSSPFSNSGGSVGFRDPSGTYYMFIIDGFTSFVRVETVTQAMGRFTEFGAVSVLNETGNNYSHLVTTLQGASTYIIEDMGPFNDTYSSGLLRFEQENAYLQAGDYSLTVQNGDLSETLLESDLSIAGGTWTVLVYYVDDTGAVQPLTFTVAP